MPKYKKKEYLLIFSLLLFLFIILNLFISTGLISRYFYGILIMVCVNIILAASLNMTVGLLGQINLGHAGFMAIGAYLAALFVKQGYFTGFLNYFISIVIGGFFALIFGFLVGIPSLRLKDDYLAIITLAFGEIIRILIEFFDFTGGAQGLTGIPIFANFNIIYVIMVLCIVFMYSLMTSRHGRNVIAIREDEIAAEASGINTVKSKVITFSISAMFAGIAGAIYSQYIGILTPGQFGFSYSIDILLMVVLGGMGSFTGSILSAIALTILPEFLRSFHDYRMIIYSIILIAVMINHPQGLLGKKEFHISKLVKNIKNKYFNKKELG